MIVRQLILLLSMVAAASAQGISTGGTSLTLPFSADQASLSDAGVASRADLGASSVNPATAIGIERAILRFTHLQWMADVRTQVLAAAVPTSSLVYTFAITNTAVPGIPFREIPGPATSEFTARAVSLRAGAAVSLSSELTAGVTFKYLYEKLFIEDATGAAFDLGLLYDSPDLPARFGASLTNVGKLSAFRTEKTDIPTALQLGANRSFGLLGLEWTGSLAYVRETIVKANHVRLGMNVSFDSALVARIGYAGGYEARGLSFGVGIRYQFLQIDYAYVPMSFEITDAHCISASMTF